MKSSLAIMLELATILEVPASPVTYVFYACEEVGRAHSGLNDLFAVPNLVKGEVALLLEPTAGGVEAGCQGTLRLGVTFAGVRAHTARPFRGVNAIHRMAQALAAVAQVQPEPVVIDGLTYAEQLQVVSVSGGVAGNVVPDEASFAVNYRFAPSTSLADAEQWVRSLIEPFVDETQGDTINLQDGAGGAMPQLTDPVIAKLVAMSTGQPTAKVGWTDCATFFERGIPACNFGPGDPLLAHHPDEHVNAKTLDASYDVLFTLLSEAAR
jgi:succinyl-diaminopimelate desuccinylase